MRRSWRAAAPAPPPARDGGIDSRFAPHRSIGASVSRDFIFCRALSPQPHTHTVHSPRGSGSSLQQLWALVGPRQQPCLAPIPGWCPRKRPRPRPRPCFCPNLGGGWRPSPLHQHASAPAIPLPTPQRMVPFPPAPTCAASCCGSASRGSASRACWASASWSKATPASASVSSAVENS